MDISDPFDFTEPLGIDPVIIDHRCEHCEHPAAQLYKRKAADGSWQVLMICTRCGENSSKTQPFVSQKTVNVGILPELPAINGEHCQVTGCLEPVSQNHHWAPQALFKDAWNWPMSWLCKKHHDIWHEKVTPDLVKRRRQ